MKISIKNMVVLGAAIAILAAAFVYFVVEKKRSRDPKDKLATLSFFKNFVESRYAGEIQWKAAAANDSLFEEDAVKTHSASEAVVTFIDNASVKVDENSVIIIRKPQDDALGFIPNFEILNGSVGVFSQNRFRVITPEGSAAFSPVDGRGSVRINVGGEVKGTRFSVLEGRGTTVMDGEEKTIKAGEGAELTDKNKGRTLNLLSPPKIITPVDNAVYPHDGQSNPQIVFQFDKTEGRVHLQVYGDENLSQIAFERHTEENSMIMRDLGKGEYYWRAALIGSNGMHGAFSDTRKFFIRPADKKTEREPDAVPQAVRKNLPMRISMLSGNANYGRGGRIKDLKSDVMIVAGDEIRVPYGSSLTLAVGKESSMDLKGGSHLLLSSLSQLGDDGDKELTATLKEGESLIYLNRVGGKEITYNLKTASAGAFLTTKAMKRPAARVLVENSQDGSTRMLVLTGRVPMRTGKKTSIVEAQTSVTFSAKAPDPVFGRVPITNVEVAEGRPNILFFEDERPLITYVWAVKGNRFVFEMSSSKDFSNLLISEYARANYFTNHSPPEGKYYWRYKDNAGKYSKAHEFTVGRTQSYSLEMRRVEIFEKEPDRLVWFERRPPVVELGWDKTPGATTYLVQIYSDPKMTQMIFEKRLTTQSLSFLADFFKEGTYYWTVSRYAGTDKLLSPGVKKSFIMKRNLESPTIKIDMPLNSSFVNTPSLITRGEMFKKAALYINGFEAFINHVGPFDFKVDLTKGKNRIAYKEVGQDGTATHYFREVIFK